MAELRLTLANGEQAGRTLQEITKQVNAAATAMKKAEIGSNEFVKASSKFKELKEIQTNLTNELKGTQKASDLLNQSWVSLLPFGGQFQNLAGKIGLMRGGVGGLITQFGLLRTAIISTGIGALIVALAAVYQWFSKTAAGADYLEDKVSGAGAAWDVFMDAVISFDSGKWNNLIGNMSAAAAVAEYLSQKFRELEDSKRELDVANANADRDVQRLLLQSQNVALSYEERLSLLDQAAEKEKANFKQRVDLANQELILAGQQLDEIQKLGNEDGEAKDKLTKARVAVINLDKESIALQEKIENRRSQLLQKRSAEEEKYAAERKKREQEQIARERKELEEAQAANDNLRLLANEKRLLEIDDLHQREIEKLDQQTTEKIIHLQGSEAQILEQTRLLREIQQKELEAIDQKYAERRAELDEQAKEEQFLRDQEFIEREIEMRRQLGEISLGLINTVTDARVASIDRETEASKRRLEQVKEDFGEESDEYRKLNAEIEAQRKVNAERIRRIEKLRLRINLAAELSGIWKHAMSEFGLFGLIVGAGLSAAALVRYQDNVKEIEAAQYEKGGVPKDGVLRGPSHGEGGIPIIAEGDEIIMTRGVYRNARLRRLASAINVAGGGRSFATGGPVDPFSSPPTTTNRISPSTDAASIFDERPAWLDELLAAQDRRIDRIRVINVLSDTEEGLRVMNTIRDDADI